MPDAFNRGVRIYWEEEGSGDPLLLIMGLGLSLAMWGELRASLSRQFRVILFDNRGVGKSGGSLLPFSIAAMAHDAAEVLNAANVNSAHVFGISMGGMIAQQFALRFPDRVRKLVLGCTHCGGTHSKLADNRVIRVLTSPFFTQAGRLAAAVPFLYYPETPRERVERDLEILRQHPPSNAAYLKQLGAILCWQSYTALPRIQNATMVIHGEDDLLIPASNGRILADRIPGANLVLLSQAGHIFPTDQPQRTREEVLRFLADPVSCA